VKTEKKNKRARREFFASLYQQAKNSYSGVLDGLEKNMSQYRGSREIDGSGEAAGAVRNITYEIIESQVSSAIPYPKADAASYSERRERNARNIERLLSSLRDKLPYETLNDVDERNTYIYGGSVWYVEWDNSARLGREVGSVRIYCISPTDFIGQTGISEVQDMEYCFLRFATTRSALCAKYGISRSDVELAEVEYCEGEGSSEGDVVSVIVAFYKDEEGEVGKFVFSGELTLSDMPRLYKRKVKICRECEMEEGECRCAYPDFYLSDVSHEEIYEQISDSDFSEQRITSGRKISVPYYTPKSFPIVIRRNTSLGDSLLGQSDCEYIRPEQQAINKIESRILQKLLRAGVTPIMPEDATVSLNNSVFGQVIRMKPGESAQQYGKVDTTPDISQDIAEAERLYEHSKRILGISDALQGLDTANVESGYARQLKISQASGRLESKKKMKHTAYAALDRLIFEQYLAFADEPRALVYRDAYGRVHNSEFNRYDFIEYDASVGEYYYDDAYLFSVDLNGGAEYQREALWQRNLENLKAGTLGNPEDNVTLLRYWQCQERAHYPHARENVEYFSMAIEEEKKRINQQNGIGDILLDV